MIDFYRRIGQWPTGASYIGKMFVFSNLASGNALWRVTAK